MASKSYDYVVYTADDGKTQYNVRMSAQDIAAQPTPPVHAPGGAHLKVKVSKNRKAFGFHPRVINLYALVSNGTLTRTYYDKIVVLAKADVATLIAAGQVTIGSTIWSVGTAEGEFSR